MLGMFQFSFLETGSFRPLWPFLGSMSCVFKSATAQMSQLDSQALFLLFRLLSLSSPEAGMLLVASTPSGRGTENPLQPGLSIVKMDDSSQMCSMKRALLVFVYIKSPPCLMSQNPNKLATFSSELSFPCTLRWCEESCPVRLHCQQMKQEKASWQYVPSNVTHRVNHRVARPEFSSSPRCLISTTV